MSAVLIRKEGNMIDSGQTYGGFIRRIIHDLSRRSRQTGRVTFKHGQRLLLGSLCLLLVSQGPAWAGQLGHSGPAVFNIRDTLMPEAGFYVVPYFFLYNADTFKDRNGNAVSSINVGPVTLNVDASVKSYTFVPALVWVSKWEILGARYGVQVLPTFSNVSFQAALRTGTGFGRGVDESNFGAGDLGVKPIWLNWEGDHHSINTSYAFYAPTGKYDNGASDNVGLGFWTHEFQVATAWFPWKHRGTAVMLTGTYEIHSKIRDVNITPGDRVSLSWGISQYLPLNDAKSIVLEVGPMGYSQWQVRKDYGSDVNTNFNVKDQIHAAGGQVSLLYSPWKASLNFHALQEFNARARFEGQWYVLSLAKGF